ncbi:MAG: hypothetical protein JWN34_2837 [Bryobacterales bacterium]|nr:hypothetical protein [Bryobacterales bacterium]
MAFAPDILAECRDPVRGDCLLSRREVELSGADELVQPVLQLVFLGCGPLARVGLRPEVLGAVRSAQRERYQMIDLAADSRLACSAVRGVDATFQIR